MIRAHISSTGFPRKINSLSALSTPDVIFNCFLPSTDSNINNDNANVNTQVFEAMQYLSDPVSNRLYPIFSAIDHFRLHSA